MWNRKQLYNRVGNLQHFLRILSGLEDRVAIRPTLKKYKVIVRLNLVIKVSEWQKTNGKCAAPKNIRQGVTAKPLKSHQAVATS